MKRASVLILGLWFASASLMATEGQKVYEQKCLSCHEIYHSISELEKNFMEHNNTLLNLKAPTINQIVFRLKSRIGDPSGDEEIHRMEVESFLADYFTAPDKSKSICMAEVLRYFETMPAIIDQLSEEELVAISEWLYAYDPADYQEKQLVYEALETASHKALAENKLLMIYVTSPRCRYCVKMEREVLSDRAVIDALNDDYVVVKANRERDAIPVEKAPKMTPTFLFLTPDQHEIYRVPGAWNKEDFLVILKEAKEKHQAYLKKNKSTE
jgi:thioredoxin-related protein